MPHYVYKYVYGNEIIYIGKTDTQLSNRISQHGVSGDNIDKCGWDEINASSIYYIELVNGTMADVVESELIRRYRPKYNKAKMSEWSGIQFVEPEWKLYKTKKQIKNENERLHDEIEEMNNGNKQGNMKKRLPDSKKRLRDYNKITITCYPKKRSHII